MTKYKAMLDEFIKIAVDREALADVVEPDAVSAEEAMASARRLRRLRKNKPTGGQLVRGAVSGATILPAFGLISSAIKGKIPRNAAGALHYGKLGREVAGDAVRGAAIGSLLPMARQYMNTAAEKEKIHQFLGTSERSPVRSQIRQTLGVG